MVFIFRFLVMFFIIGMSISFYAQEVNKKVYIGLFKPFQSSETPEISKKIQDEFISQTKDINFIKGKSTATEQSLKEAKANNADFFIDGFYKKKENSNLELFIQIYDVNTGSVIDAHQFLNYYKRMRLSPLPEQRKV